MMRFFDDISEYPDDHGVFFPVSLLSDFGVSLYIYIYDNGYEKGPYPIINLCILFESVGVIKSKYRHYYS